MEDAGLKLLRKAREATGLAIITEVMSDRDVDLVAQYADSCRSAHAICRTSRCSKCWAAAAVPSC